MNPGPTQRVVVYGPGNGRAFETAYTDEQVRKAVMRCVNTHGRRANVRSVNAREHWRKAIVR